MKDSEKNRITLNALDYSNERKAEQDDGHAKHDGTCERCARDAALRVAAFTAGAKWQRKATKHN
jgi:hypothetical protein